jgi:hypothetical protein
MKKALIVVATLAIASGPCLAQSPLDGPYIKNGYVNE